MSMLSSLWHWMQSVRAPLLTAALPVVAPTAPIRQQQFPDIAGAKQAGQQQDVRLSSAYKRLVKVNNAYVARNYGKGPVIEHHDATVPGLTEDERELLTSARARVQITPTKPDLKTELAAAPLWRCESHDSDRI